MAQFLQLVKARYSPDNKCYVPEGEVLLVRPRIKLPQRAALSHFFVGSIHKTLKARLGWIASAEPFTIQEFCIRYLGRELPAASMELDHIRRMLESVAGLQEGTPVAASYFMRNVENRSMLLEVHRVILSRKRKADEGSPA